MARPRLLALLLPLAMSGCVATQTDVLDIQSSIDDLNSTLKGMQRNQADLSIKMDELSRELTSFRDGLASNEDGMKRLRAKLEDLGVKFEGGIKGLDSSLTERLDDNQAKVNKEIKEAQSKADQLESTILPSEIFHKAFVNLVKQRYGLAESGFKLYLEKYPDGEMVEESVFRLGEAYEGQKEHKKASIHFATVLQKFPKGQFVASSRLKYGLNLLALKEAKYKDEAVKYLRSVVSDYPRSPEAATAKDELERLFPPAPKPKPKPKTKTKAPAKADQKG